LIDQTTAESILPVASSISLSFKVVPEKPRFLMGLPLKCLMSGPDSPESLTVSILTDVTVPLEQPYMAMQAKDAEIRIVFM
jgi:hypothetical protein